MSAQNSQILHEVAIWREIMFGIIVNLVTRTEIEQQFE